MGLHNNMQMIATKTHSFAWFKLVCYLPFYLPNVTFYLPLF
jgi:hypothetical protein